MSTFTPVDPDFEKRIRSSFDRQQVMQTLGARLVRLSAGQVQIEMDYDPALTQQHGYLHAGIVTTIVDSACGYAAYTLMPANAEVLTVEYKANFLSPAKGDRFLAIGKVIKPGQTITVCSGEVFAFSADQEKLVVTMQATMMMVIRPASL